jgi:Secretin and TonB N terminus short domain
VWRRVPYLAVYLMFTAVTAEAGPDSAAIGPQRAIAELSAPMSFDIPAQPLAAALDRYGDATGREVLYNPALTDGRTSEPVNGIFVPATALQLLLVGTGLAARFLKDNSFVLVPAPEAAAPTGGSAVSRQYYGVVQACVASLDLGHRPAASRRVGRHQRSRGPRQPPRIADRQ